MQLFIKVVSEDYIELKVPRELSQVCLPYKKDL